MRVILIVAFLIMGGYAGAIATISAWLGYFDIAAATMIAGIACIYYGNMVHRRL